VPVERATAGLRIHLTGGVRIEAGESVTEGTLLPGRLGRLAFAFLVGHHDRPVPREEIAELLWPEGVPATWEKGTAVLVSKLRAVLAEVVPAGGGVISNAYGCYQLNLPPDSWIDLEAAATEVRSAEAELGAGRWSVAAGHAAVAESIARRSFLPGEEGDWIESQRQDLRKTLVRALDVLAATHLHLGNGRLAVKAAAETTTLEPYRESGYVNLMRAHAAAGDRAEALRVYEACRRLIADELGVLPSPATEAAYLAILREQLPDQPPSRRPADDETRPPDAAAIDGSAAPRRESPPPEPAGDPRLTSRRPARRTAALVAVVVVAGLAATFAVVHPSGSAGAPTRVPSANAVARIGSGGKGFTLVVGVGDRPTGVASHGNDTWVINYDSQTLSRVDATTGILLATRGVGGPPTGVVYGDGTIWVTAQFGTNSGAAGTVLRFDAVTGELRQPIEVGDGAGAIAFTAGSVWVANDIDDTVVRIDPLTAALIATIPVGREPTALGASGTTVWVANTLDGTVSRISATSNTVVATIDVAQPSALAAGAGGLWVLSRQQGVLTRIDPGSDGIVATIPVGAQANGVGLDGADVWITSGAAQSVERIDASTNRVAARLRVQGQPQAIEAGAGGLWVTVDGQ
jgi:SARP family transcriptional regulator, regulator of embCAB operon